MVIYSLGNVLTSSYAKKVFWTIRDNYRRTQVYYTPYLSRLFCEFHEPENVMCWHYVKWHIEKKTNFFLNIYGWFKFCSQRVRRSWSFMFLCVYFLCYRSFSVKVYTLATKIGIESNIFRNSRIQIWSCATAFLFKIWSAFLSYIEKPLGRCIATNPLQKKKG